MFNYIRSIFVIFAYLHLLFTATSIEQQLRKCSCQIANQLQ